MNEHDLICQIAQRAKEFGGDPIGTMLDIETAHAAVRIDLERLANAPDADFVHDVAGIARHLDRTTGQLKDFFLPRFAI